MPLIAPPGQLRAASSSVLESWVRLARDVVVSAKLELNPGHPMHYIPCTLLTGLLRVFFPQPGDAGRARGQAVRGGGALRAVGRRSEPAGGALGSAAGALASLTPARLSLLPGRLWPLCFPRLPRADALLPLAALCTHSLSIPRPHLSVPRPPPASLLPSIPSSLCVPLSELLSHHASLLSSRLSPLASLLHSHPLFILLSSTASGSQPCLSSYHFPSPSSLPPPSSPPLARLRPRSGQAWRLDHVASVFAKKERADSRFRLELRQREVSLAAPGGGAM